ncbi:MAG: phage tail sheath subtilisin-like domain-containing protein [Oscillospiraceae bacterium]|nr:phage tail sheath subtilisin-like domain-containing protein [Oscillospiraceae bacterium]
MASFFIIGEKKTRPGVYLRYENWGKPPVAGVDDGKCAAVFRSNWGPLGQAMVLEQYEDIAKRYGDGGENGTTAVPLEQFKGGARLVYALRLGTGGTHGSYAITDAAGDEVIRMTLKYPGSRRLAVTIRPTLADPDTSELLIVEGTEQMEKLTFSNAENSVDALMEAFGTKGSDYFTLTRVKDSEEKLASVDQEEITGGTDPAVNVGSYSRAFEVLESYRWNVMAVDTEDTAIHAVMQLFLNRIYDGGKFTMGVIGEPSTVDFETRLLHASAYNDYQIVYVGNGFTDISGNVYEGWRAAARIAGLIAGTPSNESITRAAITGAVECTELLTNNQHERAIRAGALMFSVSAANTVWVEQGINTLVLPTAKEDEGWKKIKRVKVRFELFQRLNDTVEPLIGRINNDPDGRMTVVQVSNGVCQTMVAERKLLAGAHVENDPDNKPEGDSAWFVVYVDDIDALEKMYYTFKFRFAPEEE